MFRRFITIASLTALVVPTLPADFSYQETTKLTGGAAVAAMKMAGVFSKSARQATDGTQSTIAVKGDRLVHKSPMHTSIIDLSNETITSIDVQKKTYSVMTFAEMKQAMEQMQAKMQQKSGQNDAEMKFKVSANATGKKKSVNGFEASEMLLKMEMQGTDKKSGQSGSMIVYADSWIAPSVPGYNEARAFYKKMAENIAWTPGGNAFMQRPDIIQGMAEVSKESAKLDGMPVFQTMTMGPEGTMPQDGTDPKYQAQQQQAAQDKPSVGSMLGGALGGKFGRKKDTPPPAASDNSQASGTLMESTTEMSNFSSNAVDGSLFEIPAGFKKVEADLKRAAQ